MARVMAMSSELHLAAGLAALGLGVAALLRDAGRRRNRLFFALSVALALWTLGVAAWTGGLFRDPQLRRLYLLGSCAAAPLGLHFALALTWPRRALPKLPLAAAYVACGALWLAVRLAPGGEVDPRWKVAAIFVLGVVLAGALGLLLWRSLASPPGRERRARALVLAGGAIAVVGGLSDFVPRDYERVPPLGPFALLVFVIVVGAVVVRHRFLDADRFLARIVALAAGAAAAALGLLVLIREGGDRFVPLFVACLAILALAGPVGRAVVAGSGTLLGAGDPTVRAFLEVSRRLPAAVTTREVWAALDPGRRALPPEVRVALYLEGEPDGAFRVRYGAGRDAAEVDVPRGATLARLLDAEREPLSRRFLEDEIRESTPARRRAAREAAETLRQRGDEIAVPLVRGGRLVGWIAVGGIDEQAVTADLAAALLAVGNQAIASLERAEAVEAAERRRALAAVGEMAAGLAHEIRNPLAAIRGAAQALGPAATAEQTAEMLAVLEEETARLGRVVGEFLEYARADAGRRVPVDLAELARQVKRASEVAGIDLAVEITATPPHPRVAGDPDRLRRVFENLARNAAEASPGGTLRISIALDAPGRVATRFEDDGGGIPEAEVARLFTPFHTTKPEGTGLGLALAHRIVTDHGGTIRVDGRPGRGAAFTVVLPAQEGTA